ncbi:hypothetical protein [Pseudoalteromonas ruthenica]|uniref:hypothetical protein n=1 Tax=Pseudoalteromonas ruthenica TaxID=151081 RepID=UPI00241C4312|nr:hypothetical protein [Pseudoalteromonas ruthenica]|tara:strand:+ start:693 stop:1154 length:462 start_codon:yes stop_codon:yes gene_type:complete
MAKYLIPFIFLLYTFTVHALSVSFSDNPVWKLDCNTFNDTKESRFVITWYRDAGHATMLYENGNGKGLREIPGFSENEQFTAHFWMSPATTKITGKTTKESGHGFWVESLGPTLISVRKTGHIAVTNHDVIYGGMKAFTQTGMCKIHKGNSQS